MATTTKATKAQKATKDAKKTDSKAVKAPVNHQIVTALNLRRTIVAEPNRRLSFFLSDDDFTDLTMTGIKLGVTWDEVVRALISQMQASSDPYSSLKNFLPA